MFARILAILLTTSCLLLATPAFAQTATQSSESLPSTVSPTSPLYTDLLVSNLFHSFSCLAIGQSMIGQPCLSYLKGVPVLSKVNTSGGALGGVTSVIGMLYANPPVRTADYLASIGQDMGIIKTANAQVVGSGAAVLSPILRLWQTSRNISYVLMIIIFVIIGMMVMFRNKLNPQTVITAQAALPGLVIGLIMITFSFFLAGLISDMAFVGTNVVGYYFTAAQDKLGVVTFNDQLNLSQKISGDSVLSIFSNFVGIVTQGQAENVVSSIFDKLGPESQNWLRLLAGLLGAQFMGPLTGAIPIIPAAGVWGLLAKPILDIFAGISVSVAPAFFFGFVISLVAMLALIYQMLKLLLKLLSTYLTIIFLTITAPFQFLFASLPGRQGIATGWMLSMLGNILVFPAVIAVFYFVAFILGPSSFKPDFPLWVSSLNQRQENTFIPTIYAQEPDDQPNAIVGKSYFPLFGGIDLSFIKILLAFGALMALPSIPDLITRTVGKAGQAGQMIGQEISGGIRGGQGYLNQGRGAAGGVAGSTKQNLFGSQQWSRDGNEWRATWGSPGAFGIALGGQTLEKAGTGAAARTSASPPVRP